MSDYYEINVALKGRHYFATAPRSATTASEAKQLLRDFRARFPESEGFIVSCTKQVSRGYATDFLD